jgi:hypothetical protein
MYYDTELVDILEILNRISSNSILNSYNYGYKDYIKQLYKSKKSITENYHHLEDY